MSKSSEIKKRITITDVAEAAGVTKSTVSLALAGKGKFSPQTRSKISRVARRLNYIPDPHARRLSLGRFNNTIALLVLALDLSVGTKKLQLLQSLLVAAGYEAPLYASSFGGVASDHEKIELIKIVCNQQPRAIICATYNLPPGALQLLQRYQDEGGQVVCYDHAIDLEADQVIFDRMDNTYQATRHLLDLGHRDISLATGAGPAGPRLQGFMNALKEFGVKPNDKWLLGSDITDDARLYSGEYEEGGARLATKFLQLKQRPTAVCLLDDHAAVGFAAELERAGLRVPQDVSVVGHDDLPIAKYGHLQLTTVTHPVEAIAESVMQLLNSRLDRYDGPPREVILRGELVVRQSTLPISKLSSIAKVKNRTPAAVGA
jgi:LacI family transcriptional regulator